MKKIILTGFGEWGRNTYNSSWEILRDRSIPVGEGWRSEVLHLPVSWYQAPEKLLARIDEDTRAVVSFGMAGGAKVLCERIALNLLMPELEVVDDRPYESDHVCDGAPPAYWTKLPWHEILRVLRDEGIPCGESHYAGSHLCNFIFYWLLHFIECHRPDIVGGFVHVPRFEMHDGLEKAMLCRAVDGIARVVTLTEGPNQ